MLCDMSDQETRVVCAGRRPAWAQGKATRVTRQQARENLSVSIRTVDYMRARGELEWWQNPHTKRVWISAESVRRLAAEREA